MTTLTPHTLSRLQLTAFNTDAFEKYSCCNNEYHNFNHATAVKDSALYLLSLEGNQCDPTPVHLAGLYHDAIYFAGAVNEVNEKASAAALNSAWLTIVGEPTKVLVKALSLIENTTIKKHLMPKNLTGNMELQCLLDADLRSLALPYDEFLDTQNKIILENWGDIYNLHHRRKSAEFLYKLVSCRPYLYHTQSARHLYESQAQANIIRCVASCK